jgi:hypothetical protein
LIPFRRLRVGIIRSDGVQDFFHFGGPYIRKCRPPDVSALLNP